VGSKNTVHMRHEDVHISDVGDHISEATFQISEDDL
jgi:hypothetical protein